MASNQEQLNNCSVLMLSYNGVEDALASIASLKGQTAFIDQVFLLDNGSNAENKNLLSEAEKPNYLKIIDLENNLGFAGGFNYLFKYALKESVSDYFLVMNNDTLSSHDLLEKLLAVASPDKIVSPMILWNRDQETIIQSAGEFDTTMMKMRNTFEGKKCNDIERKCYDIRQTDGCCFLIHRHWIEEGYYFKEDLFMYFEDMEFFLRLRKAGAKFLYQAETHLLHKEYGSSGGRDQPSPLRNYYFYRNRLVLAAQLHSGFRKWRIYYLILRLAKQKYNTEVNIAPEAAHAIWEGVRDFFIGVKGKGPYPRS